EEDGIRDKLVTGVQTCALPIYPHRSRQRKIEHAEGIRLSDRQMNRERRGWNQPARIVLAGDGVLTIEKREHAVLPDEKVTHLAPSVPSRPDAPRLVPVARCVILSVRVVFEPPMLRHVRRAGLASLLATPALLA